MCNMSGFNSYPGTPLTRGNQSLVTMMLVVTSGSVTAPDGSCDHCVLVTTLARGPRGAAAVLTSVYAVYTARPVIGELCNKTITTTSTLARAPSFISITARPTENTARLRDGARLTLGVSKAITEAKDQEARKDNWGNLILGPNQRLLHKL